MNRIFVLMGKSASGKDSIFRELTEGGSGKLKTVIPYTTRPLREGEKDGVEYRFSDEDTFRELKKKGRVIEDRSYNTVQGLWRYFTVDDGSFGDGSDIVLIGTLDSFISIRDYFKDSRTVVPIYIECDDGDRLIRAVKREKKRLSPDYRELCRRFLADDLDFSEERLEAAGVGVRIKNDDLKQCVRDIKELIG
ncbi:MAG: guanylate kinase [Lachnospiraceae bacterium]|nr:guanylate kinase [Lachnospiraceae bacterium]